MSGSSSPQFREAADAFQRGDLDHAREVAERALTSAPSPQLRHLLGLIHCRRGEPAKGVDHLRAAALAEPGNAAFQVMLVRALVDSGRAEEVLRMPAPAEPMSPPILALWQARGEAANIAGKPDIAAQAWRAVAGASPDDWRAWSNLGSALCALGEWVDASEAFSVAARLNPAEPGIRTSAAAALLAAGRQHRRELRLDEAEAALRRAHEMEPEDPEILYRFGGVLERTNRLGELEDLLATASAAGIADDRLNYLRAVLARRNGRLEEARELLLASPPDHEPIRWNALRAKIADALDEPGEAFEAATAMNRAAVEEAVSGSDPEAWKKQTESYRADLHEFAATITPQWAASLPRLKDPPAQRLSFLLGFPRSGTTLLDTFLMGHPEVAVLEEKQLVGRAAEVVGGSAGLAKASVALVRKARDAYFEMLREHVSADFTGLVVDKFPLDMAAAPVIEAMFPSARMIFAQRHPCDVVLSGFMQPIGVVNFSNIEAAADYYDAMMSIWTAAREAMEFNVHTVVYEELVRDPEAVLRPTIAFLGLEWDDRILDHRRTAKGRGTIVTPSYDQVTEPVTTKPAGRWKRYRKQLEPVLPILLPWAEKLGY
ncbi:MAG TPA: sulfotransferase, partial [Sphingomicrobium sp.]|nr:sulfotransferase [Sphingomicrobium sp.]